MSSSVFIPMAYAWDSVSGDWNECIEVYIDTVVGEAGEVSIGIAANITMFVPHPCGQPGVTTETTLQLYPAMSQENPTVIQGFNFSGFYTSCQSVISTLGMPAETEIY